MLDFYRSNKIIILTSIGTLVALLLFRSKKKLDTSNSNMNKEDFFKLVGSKSLTYPTKTRKVSSPFGNRIHPISKVSKFHNGIDIPAPPKTPIYSPIDGEVVLNSYHSAGGNQIIIKNGDIRFGFAHLFEKPILQVGDKVKKGQQIGMIGNTGLSTGPHLHFTMKIGDVMTDPKKAFSEYT